MGNLSIKARLIALVAFMALALLIVGGIGLNTARNAEADIQSIYQHQTLPMRELARIRRILVENAGQIFRALQHNPAFDYAKLHEHPVAEHLEPIEKNLTWIEETIGALHQHLLADSDEARLLTEFEPIYGTYVRATMKPMLAALRSGDYSSATVAGFLKANREFEGKINPLLRAMAEAQEKAVKTHFEAATARNQRATVLSLTSVALGLAVGLLLAFLTIRSITGPVGQMLELIGKAAHDHDFTGSIAHAANDEIGTAARAFNNLMATLRQSLGQLRDNMVQIDEAAAGLATAAEQAARAANDSSESASSMAASVEQMSVSITSVSDSTREALGIANAADKHSESGNTVVGNAVADIAQIASQVRDVGENITVLGERSDKISGVVQVIKEVADQTNLLALNAAIEAARAGEMGRGFAVVADEVRKLAERTTVATGEIAAMIAAIQESARTAVGSMDTTIHRLQRGSELTAQAGEAIQAIRQSNNDVLRVVNNINDAMREQGAASYDIAQRVERVAQASEQSSASVRNSADAAARIHALSQQMRINVERFRV